MLKMISGFHFITRDLPEISHAELAEFACKGGADWVQLRVKKLIPVPSQKAGNKEILEIASEVKKICGKYGARLIVNDYVFVAKETGADGVHLGKDDMSVVEARKILGNNFIIGGTANTVEDVRFLMESGVDYIGLGPFRFTATKEKLSPVLGLVGIKNIAEAYCNKPLQKPIIAIGGIRLEDVEDLMQTGIHGIAVSSAINLAKDKVEMTKQFCHRLRKFSQMKDQSGYIREISG